MKRPFILGMRGTDRIAGLLRGPGGKTAKTAETADAQTAKKTVPEYTVLNTAGRPRIVPEGQGRLLCDLRRQDLQRLARLRQDAVPARWTIDNGAIKFNGSGGGEAPDRRGRRDLIFAHKFKNFELEMEWKVSRAETPESSIWHRRSQRPRTENRRWSPSTSPARVSGARQRQPPRRQTGVSTETDSRHRSRHDPGRSQNQKPSASGTRPRSWFTKAPSYGQNDKNVVEYHLWTPHGPRCSRTASSAPKKASGIRTAQQLRR